MTKLSFKRLVAGFFAVIASLAFQSAAWAQQATCGVSGSASATAAYYDPFNPSGLSNTTVTLTLTRINTSGGGDTRIVNFYLKGQSNVSDGTIIRPTAISGSVNQGDSAASFNLNIFHDFSAPNPQVSPTSTLPSGANRMMKINFTGGNAASNTATVTFNVQLPANLNLNASSALSFDAYFGCNIQGGQNNGQQQQGSIANAIVFPVVILSALQASYVGPVLDFGEVGDKTTLQVQAAPVTYTRFGDIRVASSGAYEIKMNSTNNYRLTFPGGNPALPGQSLAYNASLVGISRNGVSGSSAVLPEITKTCTRAGVGGTLLPVSVTLTEGGSLKTPAPAYTDFLNVTVTPQIASVVGSACP